MIRRLVEAHYFQYRGGPDRNKVLFWLRELRTPDLLIEVAQNSPGACRRLIAKRPLLAHVLSGHSAKVAEALATEEAQERERDRVYWAPLRKELEAVRRSSRRHTPASDSRKLL